MRLVRMDHVHAGGVLAKPVTTTQGTILLQEGAMITEQMIGTLHRLGVPWLFFRREGPVIEGDVKPHWVKPELQRELLESYQATIYSVQHHLTMPAERIVNVITDLIHALHPKRHQLLQPMDVRTIENDFYMHPLYVCLLSMMIGFRLELNFSELRALAIGSFLHDIGKFDPKKNDTLPPTDQHHTWCGFRLLKGEPLFPLPAAHAALQHHERVDGKGIPRSVKGSEMHLFGRIVSIASRYDQFFRALRPFSDNDPPLQHHDVYERMISMVNKEVDHDVFEAFMHSVSVYPDGTEVLLNRGQHGVVIGQNANLPSRPIIRMIDSITEVVDLSKDPRRFIIEVYS